MTNTIKETVRANRYVSRSAFGSDGDNPLVPLGAMRGVEPLDLGFALFKAQATLLIPLTVVLYLPIQIVDLYLRMSTSRPSSASVLATSGFQVAVFGDTSGHEVFILIAQSIALSMIGIGCGLITAQMLKGSTVSFGTVLRRSVRGFFVSVVIVVLSAPVYAVGSFVMGPGWIVAGGLTFMASVIAGAEGIGPVRAMKRNFKLAGNNMTQASGLFLGSMVLLWLTRGVLIAGPMALLSMLGAPRALIQWFSNATALVLLIVQPLTAAMAAASYVGIRVRSEGLDLLNRIDEIGAYAGPGKR